MHNKLAFIGGGSFGTALAALTCNKGLDVLIYDRDPSVVENINRHRKNHKYLAGTPLPPGLRASNDLKEVMNFGDIIVLSVPSHVIRTICKQIKSYIRPQQLIVSIAKGIEEGSLKRLSQVIEDEIPTNEVVVLSGPSHAEEVVQNIPTTVVVSSKSMEAANKVQDVFMSDKFRVYTNSDLVGVEIGGAVKNIIALAAGVCDGIGYGDNAKAALMTRGMSEIIRMGVSMGGKPETFSGLSGMGDLIVTCTSMHSRNRRAGILIGKGMPLDKVLEEIGMVVEGVKACKAFYELSRELKVSMPITETLYAVLYKGLKPEKGVHDLMTRDKKQEMDQD